MQKKKQLANWPLSTLIVIVCFLSVLVVMKQVQAAWVEPNYLPSDTSLLQNFVFTPLAQDLNLGTRVIIDGDGPINLNDDVSVSGNLLVSGTINGVSGGGSSSGSDWVINYPANRALHYTTTTPASGNVGIGTATPSHRLHVLSSVSPVQNAEIDLQTGGAGGDNSHWGIYHDSDSNDLRFWKGNENRVTFADTGEVAINTTPNSSYQLNVNGNTKTGIYASATANSVSGIYGYSSFSGYPNNAIGVRGAADATNFIGGTGVYGTGNIGVKAEGTQYGIFAKSSGGNAVYAEGSTGNTNAPLYVKANGATNAAMLEGNLFISSGNVSVGGNLSFSGSVKGTNVNSYLYVTNGNGAPSLPCVDFNNRGAIYFDYTNFRLYTCAGTGGWKYKTLDNN